MMLKFLLKKCFYDLWDNFLVVFISNIITGALFLGLYVLTQLFGELSIGQFALLLALYLFLFTVLLFALNGLSHTWSVWKSSFWPNIANSIFKNFGHIVFFYLLACFIGFCTLFMFPFYLQSHSYIGIMLAVVLFWVFVVILPAMFYFIPLSLFMPNDGAFLTFKKALALVLNNKGFTLFVFLKSVLEIIITLGTCFLVPGFTGICISHENCVKLLLLKHDYMRRKLCKAEDIDYRSMLENEELTLGPRTLRNTLFPWKDK